MACRSTFARMMPLWEWLFSLAGDGPFRARCVAEREGQQRWGAARRRDAVAEDVGAPTGEVCLAEYQVRDARGPRLSSRPCRARAA